MTHAIPTVPLPSPVERPQADVVLFDGQCPFCRGQVARLARWDRQGVLAFLSLHDKEVAARYPDLTHDELMQQMYLIDSRGGRHAGAQAFRYLTRRLPRLWPLAPLLHFPGSLPLWKWLYRQVASRRYWFGKTAPCEDDACSIHLRG